MHIQCWFPYTTDIFLLTFSTCFSHPWPCRPQLFPPFSWWIRVTLVLKSFFLSFFLFVSMCMPICKLMWAYCSLHSGSAWGLVATWEWYVFWYSTHCFAARLTAECLIVLCHSRMASDWLLQNKLISACKRLCILYLLNPFQIAAIVQLLVLNWFVFFPCNPRPLNRGKAF